MTHRNSLSSIVLTLAYGCQQDSMLADHQCVPGDSNDRDAQVVYLDTDKDGFGDPATATSDCPDDAKYVSEAGDCDDADAAISPAAEETCDGVDEDCDGQIDDGFELSTWFEDADADGFGSDDETTTACSQPVGFVDRGGDCDDTQPTVYPGAEEILGDGMDNDCDDGNNDLPSLVDGADVALTKIEGADPSSGLDQACALVDRIGAPALALLDEELSVVATTPFLKGDLNMASLPQLALERDGDLELRCLPDLDGDGATEFAVGAPDASEIDLFFGDAKGASATFSDPDPDAGLGCDVAVHDGRLVLGTCSDDGSVVLVQEEIERGSQHVSTDVGNSTVRPGIDSFGRSMEGQHDLTGDGVTDLAVGGAAVAIVYDGADLAKGTWTVALRLTGQHSAFGTKVVAVPNVIGNDIDDLVVSDPSTGDIYVVPGGTFGEYPVESVATLVLDGEVGAGTDIAAIESWGGGEPGFAIGSPDTDEVIAYRASDVADLVGTYLLDLSTACTVIEGPASSDFGAVLDSADLTADGTDELVVGAPDWDGGRGQVLVLSTQR